MITIVVNGNDIVIPNLTNANVTVNERNRVIIDMNDGYVFWDRKDYRDENGEMYEPTPEEIGYSRWGSFSPTRDFSTLEEAVEADVPADQIYGDTPDHETV
jgi:hypothetical protein